MYLLDDPLPQKPTKFFTMSSKNQTDHKNDKKPSNHTNENIALFKHVTASSTKKNKKQMSISDLVILTKKKREL